ncbi:MAG: FKBP-type peptidyl-prolyl cis-trans isomerase [Bacteroidia bacterium]
MNFRILFLALLAMSILASCGNNDRCDADDQEARIQKYVSDNNLVTQRTASGIHYIIEEEGSQIRPIASSTVSVIYKGYRTDGTVFDETSTPISFGLNGVIAGWTEGIPLFKKGGKGTLIIPCQLGYGEQNRTNIPPATVLIFDIELVDVQ